MASGGSVNRDAEFKLKRERNKLSRFIKAVESKPYQILQEEAPRILREMQLQVPVDSGDLYRSLKCYVSGKPLTPTLTASASSIHNGYDYAEIQHENQSFNHPNGGKWHYVSDPFNAGVERIERRYEEEIGFDK